MSDSHMTRQHSTDDRRLGDLGSRVVIIGGLTGVAGLTASVAFASFNDNWERFFRSYLMAFMFVLSLSLGALFFTILQHCVKAGWSVAIRRLAEGMASNLMWLWVFFIPIAAAVVTNKTGLYHWMHPQGDDVLMNKAGYFFFPTSHEALADAQETHVPWFWLARAVFFFGTWGLLARFYLKNSVAQDATGDPAITRRMEKFAPVAVGLYFITQAFASIDWVMSLSPHWFSTMFPVYFFAASCCGYFAVQIVMMFFVQRHGLLKTEITHEHYQDAGKLLFAFGIVFWAYIAFSQYMLIWYANIPEETPWYFARQVGGWGAITLLLLFGHFLGPFVGIISRHPKRQPGLLTIAAGWMLFMQFIDVYWLAMPNVPEAIHHATSYRQLAQEISANMAIGRGNPGFNPALDCGYGWSALDLTCVVGLAGMLAAGTARRLSGCALIPERDPRLHESLAFENM